MSHQLIASSSAATGVNHALLKSKTEMGAGFAGANKVDDKSEKFVQNVRALLGDQVDLRYLMNLGPMTTYSGHSHSTTGIPYAINGTARVINQKVAVWLASFEDPIKAVLGTSVVREQKIIVTRKYVVGGSALITPERAPARTVSIKEDAREEILCRYGGDLEMNLNLFLRPDEAQEELTMKLEAQRAQLQQVLVSLGYEKVMNQAAGIVQAIQRASALSGNLDPRRRAIQADRIFAGSIFATFNKNLFPIQNVMASLSKANIYTPHSGARGTPVLLVPPGVMDLSKYCEKSEMNFSVSGLSIREHGDISLPLRNTFTEPNTGLRVLVHFPDVSNADGAARPQVVSNELARNIGISMYYMMEPGTKIVDFKERRWSDPTFTVTNEATNETVVSNYLVDNLRDDGARGTTAATTALFDPDTCDTFLMRPNMVLHMLSAIFCNNPGTETGDLVYAYPSTAVSTSQTTESMRMQLRVYCGCVIKNPDNLIILNDIMSDGLVSGHGVNVYTGVGVYDPEEHDLIPCRKLKATPWSDLFKDELFISGDAVSKVFSHEIDEQQQIFADPPGGHEDKNYHKRPILPYRGATKTERPNMRPCYISNNGHLGCLDDPDMVDVLEGFQVYKERKLHVSQDC